MLAIGVTRSCRGDLPPEGMFTFAGKGLRGGCFHAAGFPRDGMTADGRLYLRPAAERFPPPIASKAHMLFEDHPATLAGDGASKG